MKLLMIGDVVGGPGRRILQRELKQLKAERGNAEALAAAASRVLKKYKGAYCVESFDPRCLMWLWHRRSNC